jgi:hypothetical protein
MTESISSVSNKCVFALTFKCNDGCKMHLESLIYFNMEYTSPLIIPTKHSHLRLTILFHCSYTNENEKYCTLKCNHQREAFAVYIQFMLIK